MSCNETENAPEHNSVTDDHRNGTPTLSSSSQGEVLYLCMCSADLPDHTCRERLNQTLVRLVSLAPGAPTPIPDVPRTSNSEMNMHHMCVNWSHSSGRHHCATMTGIPDGTEYSTDYQTGPPLQGDPTQQNDTISRVSDAHDTSEHHHLGDEELAQIRLDHSNVHHKVPTLTTTAGSSMIGQSPSPYRATRYQSVPPDEDELPKRVAVVATNGTKATTLMETPPSPPTTPLDNQLDQNVTVLSSNHARTTVTPDNIQSSPNDGIGHQPTTPSTALEEATDWPVHPATRDTHTAPPPVRIILDKMNNVLLKNHMIIIDTIKHKKLIQEQIKTQKQWDNVRQHLTPTLDNQSIQQVITAATSPLLRCIHHHYNKIISNTYQHTFTLVYDTHHVIHSDTTLKITPQLATTIILESIENLILHLEPTNNKERNNMCTNTEHNDNANTKSQPQHTTNTTPQEQHNTDTTPRTTHTKQKHNRKKLKERNKSHHTPHAQEECLNPDCFQCALHNIVNLSDTQLSKTQVILLNKGLSFVPTAYNAKPTEILKDFNNFTIKTKKSLIRLANPPKPRGTNDEPRFYRKPILPPTSSYQTNTNNLGPKALEDAFEATRCELAQLKNNTTIKHNLTRKERITLKQLTTNHNLIINRADKGSTIVVRNREDYIREGLEHLSDKNTYLELDHDMTEQVTTTIRHTLRSMKNSGLLSPNMVGFCLPPHTPRTAVIYFLKKIHKQPMSIRPIVSTVNSATANLAEFLDHYLQPIMKQLPAYLKDTTQFLCEIAHIPIHRDTWLVTVDVKSLYTNIPNEEGIQACYEAWLTQETTDPQHPPAETLRQLLELVLKLNVFEFDNKHYLQIFGTAMGSKLAPAYANTFMGKLEKTILDNSPLKPSYYRRFIDDIFLIWPHSKEELDRFLNHMNNANQSIQFTSEHSKEEIVFLDVVVYKKNSNNHVTDSTCTLHTKTYIKPTNKQLYVRKGSYHPGGTGKGITVGEAIRFLRTNSELNNFSTMMMLHKRNLIKRGYTGSEVNRHLNSIKFHMRTSRGLKTKQHKTNHTTNTNTTDKQNPQTQRVRRPTFITRYCPNAKKAFRIIRKHWTSINTEIPILKRFLKTTPRMAYKSNANFTKRLVRAKLKNPNDECIHTDTTKGTNTNDNNPTITARAKLKHQLPKAQERGKLTPCSNKRCILHDRLIHSSTVRSKITRRTHHTRGRANCNTPHVVYLIQCKSCKKQYVGQTTQSLKMRFARHLTAIRNTRVPGTLHEHFRPNRPCHGINNITIQLLQTITPHDGETTNSIENKLKKLETLWIRRLKCVHPQGLNWIEYDPKQRYKP